MVTYSVATVWNLYVLDTFVFNGKTYNNLSGYAAEFLDQTYTGVPDQDMYVDCDLSKLNIASIAVKTPGGPIPVGTVVSIMSTSVTGNREIFFGVVKKYTSLSQQTSTSLTYYKYELAEFASTLEQTRVSGGSTSAPYVVPFSGGTVNQAVAKILVNTGWSYSGPNGNSIPATEFYYVTVMSALNNIVISSAATSGQVQYKMWFSASSAECLTAPTVYWGTQRNDMTGWNFTAASFYNYSDSSDNNKRQVDAVIVIGQNMASSGQWPASFTGHNIAVYNYNTATSNEQCTLLATRLYMDYLQHDNRLIQFDLRPEWAVVNGSYIQEGDLVQFTAPSGTVYTLPVIQMLTTPKAVTLVFSANKATALDVYGNSLTVVEGDVRPYSEQTWSGGMQLVGKDKVAASVAFPFTITDVTQMQDLLLHLKIGPYTSSVTTATSTQYLSDISQVRNDGVYTDTNFFDTGNTELFDITCTTMSNGCQFAEVVVNGDLLVNSGGPYRFRLTLSYDLGDGAGWVTDPQKFDAYIGSERDVLAFPITMSWLLPGTTYTSYAVSVLATVGGTNRFRVYNNMSCYVRRVTRHYHSITAQTNDVAVVAATPTSLDYKIVNPDGSTLVDWTEFFATGATSFSVTPTQSGTHQILIRSHDGTSNGSVTASATWLSAGT